MVTYNTSTMGGSSGSPCFDRQLRLSALHHSAKFDAPANEGTPTTAIIADLTQQKRLSLVSVED